MGNLNVLTPKDFAKAHHKIGYKELGWSYVRIIFTQNNLIITEPFHSDLDNDNCEYIVWNEDIPIAEFKDFDDAHGFVKSKINKEGVNLWAIIKQLLLVKIFKL